MPGVRLNGFLASTAIMLLLSGTASGAFAQAVTAPGINAATPAAAPSPAAAVNPTEPTNAPAPAPVQTSNDCGSCNATTAGDPAPVAAKVLPNNDCDCGTPPSPPAATANAAATSGAEHSDVTGTAVEPSPAVTATPPVSTVATADAAISEQLHQLASGKFDHLLGGKAQRTSIEAFYSAHNYAPLWITDGQPNGRAKAAAEYLAHVDADGLEPAEYPTPNFSKSAEPPALAEAELRLTASVVTYAHHAAIGRVHWSRVSADISYNEKAPEPADVLGKMLSTNDAAAALAAYEPHAPGYLALKAKLAQIRSGKGDDSKAPIPNGPTPKIGEQDNRVPQLRERLGVTGDGNIYDKAVAEAVKKFQKAHDLKPSGMLTAPTVDALNGRRPDRETDVIIANMERWRWMPHDLGKTYVIVNLPDYTLRVMHDGKQVWMTKIVDGKPGMPTPIMTAEMKFITVNPTWNVPPSIVNHEYLPALQQDPTVLERMGLRVDHNRDGTIHISQPPGDRNALGRVRFNFPNKFLVYQHDTPDKYMFAYEKRAFSHGCMRVLDPPKYAEVLLSLVRPGDGYTAERIKRMYGPSEVNIDFPTFIPVHLTYQTAFVDDNGKLEFREDIYGRDRALMALLKGEERKVADIPVEHRIDASHRQVLAIPDQPSLFGGFGGRGGNVRGAGPYGNMGAGDGLFSRLFGGFGQPTPPTPRPANQHRRVSRSHQTVER